MTPLQIPDLSHYESVSSFHDVAAAGGPPAHTHAPPGAGGRGPPGRVIARTAHWSSSSSSSSSPSDSSGSTHE